MFLSEEFPSSLSPVSILTDFIIYHILIIMRYGVYAVAVILSLFVFAGCSGNKTAGAASVVHNAVWSDGTWIRDTQGRVIIIHGINVSQYAKHSPFLPFPSATLAESPQLFAGIKQAGFNAVRLIIIWAAIEPTPGTINKNYLKQLQQEVQMGKKDGLLFLLDMHQDLYSQSLCGGDGAPKWACDLTGYDTSQCNTNGWALNYTLSSVKQSFQNLWDDKPAPDGRGLQEHYAEAFQAVARRFTDTSNLLGYEIMNEPFPGNYNLLSTDFEIQALAPFYEKLTAAIRKIDPEHIIAFEPSVTRTGILHDFNTGISETTFPQDFPNLVFTPHYYPRNRKDLSSPAELLSATIPVLAQVSSSMKTPYIIDEFGLDPPNVKNSAVYMVDLLNDLTAY